MPGKGIEVEGLDDFRRDLSASGKQWPRELGKAHKLIAREVASEGRQFARGHGGSTAHFANTIYGIGSPARAAIANRGEANAAIYGAKRSTGWNRRDRPGGKRQHPAWVGNSWQVGGPGGPRGINDAIRHDLPKIDQRYYEVVREVGRKAFPEGK